MADVRVARAATGVPGLDDLLAGGFARGSLFLIEGTPGTGKTTLALRHLLEGADTSRHADDGAGRRSNRGFALGEPLTGFHGVLRGIPTYRGSGDPLLRNDRS